MPPRNIRHRARMREGLGQQRIACQRAGLVQFAGIHVRFAGVAGTVDDERRLFHFEKSQQQVEARVIHLLSRKRDDDWDLAMSAELYSLKSPD